MPDATAHPLRLDLSYAMVPVDLILDPQLYPADVVVAAVLVTIAGRNHQCWPCNATVAQQARCSPETVKRALRRLEWAGWIGREKAPTTRRGNLIRLLWRVAKRSPREGRKGGSSMTRGWVTSDPGVGHGRPPELDSKTRFEKPERVRDPEDPGTGPERDLLTPEQRAYWVDLATAGDRTMQRLARLALKTHDEAEQALKARAAQEVAAGKLAKAPPAADQDTVPDVDKVTTARTRKSRSVDSKRRSEHKSHYKK